MQDNYWRDKNFWLISMVWILPMTKCAPWSKNGRPWLKLMLMWRLLMVISFIYSVLVLVKISAIRFRRPLVLSINRSTKSRRWWWKSWPKRCRQMTWKKWSIIDPRYHWKGHRKGLPIYLSASWCLCWKTQNDWENSWSFMVKVALPEKLLVMRHVLKLNEPIDMSPQSRFCLKFRHLMVTYKKAYL